MSPEHRAKIAAGLRGRELSPEHRAKISAARKGRKLSAKQLASLPRVEHRNGKKRCPRCGEWKELAAFSRAKTGTSDGLQSRCKACDHLYYLEGRERYLADARRYKIERAYGLTVPEYEAILARGCTICGTHQGKLCLDHNHRNGKVRAALCSRCNNAIGLLDDDAARMRAAAGYIEAWQREHAFYASQPIGQ